MTCQSAKGIFPSDVKTCLQSAQCSLSIYSPFCIPTALQRRKKSFKPQMTFCQNHTVKLHETTTYRNSWCSSNPYMQKHQLTRSSLASVCWESVKKSSWDIKALQFPWVQWGHCGLPVRSESSPRHLSLRDVREHTEQPSPSRRNEKKTARCYIHIWCEILPVMWPHLL